MLMLAVRPCIAFVALAASRSFLGQVKHTTAALIPYIHSYVSYKTLEYSSIRTCLEVTLSAPAVIIAVSATAAT